MSSMQVSTVKVDHLGGDFSKRGEVMIINQSVYDADPECYAVCGESDEAVVESKAPVVYDDYSDLTKRQMKQRLRDRGEDVPGNPSEETLLNRLREDD